MSTDPSHDASAYLDGASTPAERAAVESDPVALGEVERFRALRDELRATDGLVDGRDGHAAGAQERAIVAALAAFDELYAPPAAAVAGSAREPSVDRRDGSVVPIPSRRGLPAWLGAAAAVVLVVAAGALLVSIGGGDDQDEASTEPATLSLSDDAGADGGGDVDARSAEAATATEEAAPMVAAEDAPVDDATSGGATAEGDAALTTDAPAAAEDPEVASTLAPTPDPDDPAEPVDLVGIAALSSYTEETIARWRDAGTWPPAPDDGRCLDAAAVPADAIALGEVRFAATGAEEPAPALLVTDPSTTRVVALDPVDCRVLAEAELDVAAP